MKMYYKLPEKAKRVLVYMPYSNNPMTLAVCCIEVMYDSKLGKEILKGLDYKNGQWVPRI